MIPAHLPSFLVVVALITATPGPDTALVVRNTVHGGMRAGLFTALGCSTGLLLWGTASSLGLTAILNASSTLFGVVRLAGGAYLLWLGGRMLWKGCTGADVAANASDASPSAGARHRSFMEGLLTDLLNPKAAAFFTALLPQFIASGEDVLLTTLLLAAIAAGGSVVGLFAYACIAARARVVLSRTRTRHLLDQVTGAVLVALGVRMLARAVR